MSARARFITITRAAIIAGIVIAVFGAFGQQIFDALGVTAEAFSIAGGVLLFLVAIDMLFGRPSGARETPREAREARSEARRNEDVSVFPLAIPMIAGPGTITTIILLVNASKPDALQLASVAAAAAITLVGGLVRHDDQRADPEANRNDGHPGRVARAGDAPRRRRSTVHPQRDWQFPAARRDRRSAPLGRAAIRLPCPPDLP